MFRFLIIPNPYTLIIPVSTSKIVLVLWTLGFPYNGSSLLGVQNKHTEKNYREIKEDRSYSSFISDRKLDIINLKQKNSTNGFRMWDDIRRNQSDNWHS